MTITAREQDARIERNAARRAEIARQRGLRATAATWAAWDAAGREVRRLTSELEEV